MIKQIFASDFAGELHTVSASDPLHGKFFNLAKVINDFQPYIIVLSGLILLVFLMSGGLDLMLSGGDPKKTEAGKEKITNSIIGFLIVFSAYWIYRIVLFIFGMYP